MQQRLELSKIQVVRSGNTFETILISEVISRKTVGDIKRVIADAPAIREEFQVIIIADEIAIGVAGAHLLEYPLLAGFEDAGRSDE